MFDRLKNAFNDYPTTFVIASSLIVTAAVLVATRNTNLVRGSHTLELSADAVKGLLDGKEVLVDCLDDAYLLIKYIPK